MISSSQKQLLRLAVFQRLRLNDQQYRTILRSVAGVESSEGLDNRSFEKVMAVLEEQGFRQIGKSETYWRDQLSNRGGGSERQLHLICELAAKCPYPLESMVWRISSQRTQDPAQLSPREKWQLTESLKAIIARKEQGDLKQKIATQFSLFPQSAGLPDAQAAPRKPSKQLAAHPYPAVTAEEIPF